VTGWFLQGFGVFADSFLFNGKTGVRNVLLVKRGSGGWSSMLQLNVRFFRIGLHGPEGYKGAKTAPAKKLQKTRRRSSLWDSLKCRGLREGREW